MEFPAEKERSASAGKCCRGLPSRGKHDGLSRKVALRGDGLHRIPLGMVASRADAAGPRERRRWCREISTINRVLDGTPSSPFDLRSKSDGTSGSSARVSLSARNRRDCERRFYPSEGPSRELKYESYREGGVVEYEHKLVTQVSFPVVVLERGLALDDLWKWAQAVADGDVQRRTVWIRLQDETGEKGLGMAGVEYALPSSGRRRTWTRRTHKW